MKRIIGIPANGPELEDSISAHFGHCCYFVGIELDDSGDFKRKFALHNNGHSGCMEPVINMRDQGVTDMVIGGIGGRPYMGFLQVGINLYQGVEGSIKQNIEALLANKLKPLGGPSCGGGNANHTCQQ